MIGLIPYRAGGDYGWCSKSYEGWGYPSFPVRASGSRSFRRRTSLTPFPCHNNIRLTAGEQCSITWLVGWRLPWLLLMQTFLASRLTAFLTSGRILVQQSRIHFGS
jgi:hypothetical protein